MKTSICTFCAQTGMLCKECQKKLDTKEITQTDLKISKIAFEYEKAHPQASKVTIMKIFERPNQILILVSPGSQKYLVGGTKDFDKRIERVLNKPVRIMEKSPNKRKTIDDIFFPALIKGINTVFVPIRTPKPGQRSVHEETIVLLSPEEKSKLPATVEELKELVKSLVGEDIRVEFR